MDSVLVPEKDIGQTRSLAEMAQFRPPWTFSPGPKILDKIRRRQVDASARVAGGPRCPEHHGSGYGNSDPPCALRMMGND